MSVRSRIYRERRLPAERPLAAIVEGLWRNNEQGVEYDIPGFRDSWNNVGPELVTNGDFSAGSTGWTLGAGYSVDAGALKCATTSNQTAGQDMPIVAGRWYIVSLEVLAYSSGNIRVNVGGNLASVPNPAALGNRKVLVQAGANYARFLLYAGDVSVGGTASFDNVSVREWLAASSCTLFQDASGTLPVYMPGQGQVDPPVGLMLDKRFGLRRGENVWQDSSVTLTGQASRVSAGVYRIYTPDGSISAVNHPVTAGRWYAVSFRVAAVAVASVGLYIGPSVANPVFVSAYTVAGQTVSAVVCATGSVLSIARNASTTDVTIDSVVFRELKGDHAYQTTTTSRPTLSARYNGFVASEKFDDPYWTWQASFSSSKTSEIADPDGGSNAWKITSTNNNAALSRAGVTGFKNPVFTLVCRPGTWNPSILVRNGTTATNLIQGTYGSADSTGTYGKFRTVDLGNGWKQMQIEITSGAATTDSLVCYLGSTGAVPVGQYLYLYRADIREAGDGVGLPPYQRVVDPNTYDTVGFPPYLKPDGVDDWMQTASIDFSGINKVLVAAAFRKISDASVGMLAELGPDVATSDGSFAVYGRNPGTAEGFSWRSRGTALATLNTSGDLAPKSAVVIGQADIAAQQLLLRINGALAATTSVSQGAGSYGNYPLYLFRRAGLSLPFGGRFYGLIIRGGSSSNLQIAAVEKLLNKKAKVY